MLKNEVRAFRTRLGWSQDDLARRTGLSRAGISAIETGRLVPSTAAALALAAALGCSVEALFRLEGSGAREVEAEWAWPRESDPCRYWRCEVGGRRFLYPVEDSPLGLLPHHGTFQDGVLHDHEHSHAPGDPERTLVLACCDPAVGILAAELARQGDLRLIVLPRSSKAALELLAAGLVHAAGVHLARSEESEGNAAAVRRQLGARWEAEPKRGGKYQLLRVADWEEGIALGRGLGLGTIRAVRQAKLRWVVRESGSGAQECLQEVLGRPDRQAEPEPLAPWPQARNHRGVAEAIRGNWADAGICLRLASEEARLAFLGVRREAYEICLPGSLMGDPRVRALIGVVRSAAYRRILGELPGYDASRTGELLRITPGPA